MPTPNNHTVRRWEDVTPDLFNHEITARNEPAVLVGLVDHWPAVQYANRSDRKVCEYLAALDSGALVESIMTPPEARGRISYNDSITGFNYLRNQVTLTRVMEQVLRYALFPSPPAVAAQSAPVISCLPGFLADHAMPLLPATVQPRIWLGNRVITPAHIDESHNIACVVSGQRLFTLFPPEQGDNLYLGPRDLTPTGSPISLVDFAQPDFESFPNFRTALAHAQVALLEPGDALYIPTGWWHHVQSLSDLNILVNYWWTVEQADLAKSAPLPPKTPG